MRSAIFLAIACRQPATPPRPAVEDSGTVPVPAPAPEPTGPPADHPALTTVGVPPTTVLVGAPATEYNDGGVPLDGLSLGVKMVFVPPHGGDPAVMFLARRDTEEEPEDFYVVPGDPPPGRLDYRDWIQGTLDQNVVYEESLGPVADIDGDGHLDVWLYDRMLRGPFLGRDIVYAEETTVTESVTQLAGGFGGFDADGDGHEDLVLDSGGISFVLYGPFAGEISAQAPEVSHLGTCIEAGLPWFELLPDFLGPGQHALAKGGSGLCGDTRLYPAQIPRGVWWTEDDAFARNHGASNGEPSPVQSLGDVDGDGHPDVVSGASNGSTAYRGPVVGDIGDLPELFQWSWTDSVVLVDRVVGDVNGDGLPDMTAHIVADVDFFETPDFDWAVLLLSPFDTVIDPWKDGIPIGQGYGYRRLGEYHADLDGDGLQDLVLQDNGDDGAGYVSIWYARDLLTHAPDLED